jgi:hypothetical protein
MQPCWDCRKRKGYKIIKRNLDKKWWQFWKSNELE